MTSIFSKTVIDRAKRFSPMKTTFQDEQAGWFSPHPEKWKRRKIESKFITVSKLVKFWIHSSLTTLEAYKSERVVETNCYKYKRKTREVLLEWFSTTRTAATTPRISIFTLSLLKIRAVFLMFPNVCFLISRNWKKISTNGLHHCKLDPLEGLNLENEQNRTNLRYWKVVANEKCTPKIGELSSVKKLFWVNHASKKAKKARISLKRKIFGWTNVPEKMNWLYSVILENWGRNGQKTPKIA